MNQWNIVRALALAALIAGPLMVESQLPSAGAPKPAASQVQRITLPQIPADILPGPNLQVYEKNCLICHSARYVTMQPRFSRAVWQAEVKKMADVYGGSISEADQALIVEYLVAVRGPEAPANTPAK